MRDDDEDGIPLPMAWGLSEAWPVRYVFGTGITWDRGGERPEENLPHGEALTDVAFSSGAEKVAGAGMILASLIEILQRRWLVEMAACTVCLKRVHVQLGQPCILSHLLHMRVLFSLSHFDTNPLQTDIARTRHVIEQSELIKADAL